MKNKEITMHELMGLIKDGKAPKKIIYDETIYYWEDCSYRSGNGVYLSKIIMNLSDDKIVNLKIEILSEEKDEWEDIEEIENIDDFSVGNLTELNSRIINKLIKNQQKIIEKLEEK